MFGIAEKPMIVPSPAKVPAGPSDSAKTSTVFLALATFWGLIGSCEAIKCYKCAVTLERNYLGNATVITPMCSKFTESEDYMVDCPYSTMCLKTISMLHLQSGQKQETVTRGCAQQKATTQVFRNRQWQQEHSVEEVYTEGCGASSENNLIGSSKTLCYCRGDLCNSAPRVNALLAISKELLAVIVFLCIYIL